MISRNQFTRLADRDDVDAKTVERDYVLTHIVAGLARQPGHEHMAFKGGTALRLCFFEDYRYSADLDFSLLNRMSKQDALAVVARALEDVVEVQAFPHLALSNDGARVEYRGPLGGDRLRDVKLDIAEDELVINTASTALLTRYEDQPSASVVAYTLEEVAAEKLRCVMQRMQARDLFDLHQLFVERGLRVDEVWPDFEAKARHKGKDPDRFGESFTQRLASWKRVWEGEMETHVPAEVRPKFGAVERTVTRELRAWVRRAA
jgi:predicted nucleotidyltransferase component of viral defense system